MNKLTDTHAHFDWFESNGMTEQVLERAKTAGVERIVAIGATHESNLLVLRLEKQYPDILSCAIGYDRDQAEKNPSKAALDDLLSANPGVCAVGEIGLDYHYQADSARQQRKLFVEMLDLARKHDKTVSIHSREADADTLAILDEHIQELGDQPIKAILHCFTGNQEFCEKLVQKGLFISFSGILTFNSAEKLQQIARIVPENRILLETDCPYLAPVPMRGRKNEPAFIEHTACLLAQLRDMNLADLAKRTTANAKKVFKEEKANTESDV